MHNRMIMDINGFNALITHIQELNYEVRETPLEGGVVLNEIVCDDGTVVGTFKTYEGGIPFDNEERDALRTVITALEDGGMELELDKFRKMFPNVFDAPLPMSAKNKARATRVADLIAAYPDGNFKNADELLKMPTDATEAVADVISDCCHLVQYALQGEPGDEDGEYISHMNEFVVVNLLDTSISVRRCVAEALYGALNNYTCESRGEE